MLFFHFSSLYVWIQPAGSERFSCLLEELDFALSWTNILPGWLQKPRPRIGRSLKWVVMCFFFILYFKLEVCLLRRAEDILVCTQVVMLLKIWWRSTSNTSDWILCCVLFAQWHLGVWLRLLWQDELVIGATCRDLQDTWWLYLLFLIQRWFFLSVSVLFF